MIKKDIDFNELTDIFKEYKKDYNPIINKFTHNIIFVVDKKIVSFIVYSLMYENVEIIDVFTNKNYRNKGYSYSLLKEIINDNKDKNITLEVSKENISAINLYKKVGFEEVAIRKGYYDGIDALLMLKK